MELKLALELFELDDGFSARDLEEKYKVLASKFHPDKGGCSTKMADINTAKDALSKKIEASKSLIPVEAIKDIVIATNKGMMEYEDKKEASRSASKRIVDIHTSRPKKLKKMATLFGSIAAAGVFLGKDIPEKFFEGMPGVGTEYSAMFTFAGLAIGMYAAVIWWILDNKINSIEQETSNLDNNLTDNAYYVDLIHQALGELANGSFERRDLEDMLNDWSRDKKHRYTALSKLIRTAGTEEIAQLILVKGIETEMLNKTKVNVGKRIRVKYELNLIDDDK